MVFLNDYFKKYHYRRGIFYLFNCWIFWNIKELKSNLVITPISNLYSDSKFEFFIIKCRFTTPYFLHYYVFSSPEQLFNTTLFSYRGWFHHSNNRLRETVYFWKLYVISIFFHIFLADYVIPVCLPFGDDENEQYQKSKIGAEQAIHVAGWGATNEKGEIKLDVYPNN